MKKYLYGALALPLLFACSSDDLLEKEVISNDQFAGIEKVDATFFMDEGQRTRFDGVGDGVEPAWTTQEKDTWGFAWMTNDYTGTTTGTIIGGDGQAYQNHNLIQTDGVFKPQTSVYVGQYFLYRPFDETTVDVGKINFNSLAEQTIAEGYESKKQPWKNLAKTAINIGDKWTEVTPTGYTVGTDPTVWNQAGTKGHYEIYAAMFSNQTGLDLTYTNNKIDFSGQTISGATDIIGYKYPAGQEVDAADIYSGTVLLEGAAQSFTYAPTKEPNNAAHNGNYWETKSGAAGKGVENTDGFAFTAGAITLKAEDAKNGISTNSENNKGWFWFNSLPVTAGNAKSTTNVTTTLDTSFGTLTMTKSLADCAWAFEDPAGTPIGQKTPVKWVAEWIQLAAADADPTATTPRKWDPSAHNTFINQYGNHKGKYALTADFKECDMSVMHIKNDAHLQKALKFYITTGKDNAYELLLDKDDDNEFKISKISIALIQTIQAAGHNVKVKACTTPGDTPDKIVVTQEGQDKIDALKDKKAVPALDKVFATATNVYLSKDYDWTWNDQIKMATVVGKLAIDANVTSIINEGTLTVTTDNIELSETTATLANAEGATMNITKVTTVKNALTNLGTINVGEDTEEGRKAELRAYNVAITNDATSLTAHGVINNFGVVGVSDIGTLGKFNNYGLINVKNADAITLLSTNEETSNFDDAFNAASNKMGVVVIPSPTALVSVANADANGFIEYTWTAPADNKYTTPAGNVKYNTIVVSEDIQFTEAEPEIQYVKFDGKRTQVINNGYLTKLKGVIVNAGKSIIIEKGNKLVPANGTFLGAGATVYNGGTFTHNAAVAGTTASNYFGEWQTTQIVKY